MDTPVRTSPRRRLRLAGLLVASGLVLVLGAGCGVAPGREVATGGKDTTTTTEKTSDTSTTGRTVTTTTTEVTTTTEGSTGGATTPAGFKKIDRTGIDVMVSVPKAWVVSDLSGADLTEAQRRVAEENPQLGALGQGVGIMAGAKGYLAMGPTTGLDAPVLTVAQTTLSLPTIPSIMVEAVKTQFEGLGATDVTTESVSIPGLDASQKGLRIDATLTVSGIKRRIHEVLVPATGGMAVVAVQAEDALAESILATVEAR